MAKKESDIGNLDKVSSGVDANKPKKGHIEVYCENCRHYYNVFWTTTDPLPECEYCHQMTLVKKKNPYFSDR